jgi:tetratricopeptide (TPR) repeat protein
MVDEIISILSNADFYHYTDDIHVHIESLHNYETDQSVIFDLADSSVYFTYYAHYAAWNRWLKYNYVTRKVSVYKEADPRLSDPVLAKMTEMYGIYEACDWRDSSNVRSLLNSVKDSKIENYFSLLFLSKTYLDTYKNPAVSLIYTQKLIDKYPDIMTGYFQKARVLEEGKLYSEAIEQYKLACDIKITCEYYLAAAYERLANLYISLNEKVLAAEYADKSLNIYDQYWTPEYLKERIEKLEVIKDQTLKE